MFCLDLNKAFLQIALNEDQAKLLFLWYRDVSYDDRTIVAYKCLRFPMGLRPSPILLMLTLYKILIENAETDPTE